MAAKMQWSYSRLNSFKGCPKKYFHLNVAKDVPFTESPAMKAGSEVHKAIERRLATGMPLPPELARLEPVMQVYDQAPGEKLVEAKLAFNRNWEPVGYFDYDVWARFGFDHAWVAGEVASITDWKNGRRMVDGLQLSCFALAGFKLWPHVQQIHTQYFWTQTGDVDPASYDRSAIPRLESIILPKVEELQRAYDNNEWPMRKNYCNSCEVKKAGKCNGL